MRESGSFCSSRGLVSPTWCAEEGWGGGAGQGRVGCRREATWKAQQLCVSVLGWCGLSRSVPRWLVTQTNKRLQHCLSLPMHINNFQCRDQGVFQILLWTQTLINVRESNVQSISIKKKDVIASFENWRNIPLSFFLYERPTAHSNSLSMTKERQSLVAKRRCVWLN